LLKYNLSRVLGNGTSAVVRQATRLAAPRVEVAVKIIRKKGLDSQASAKIASELKAWRQLYHPSIVRLFEVYDTPMSYAMVCELCEAGDLLEHINETGYFQEEEAKPLARQILEGVAHCHKLGVVHRDLKLENILIHADGTAKLADFGFAGFFDVTGRTFLQEWCGSPPYAAPEIFLGRPYIGPEVDVWSFGVVLYAICTGALPFRTSNMDDLSSSVVEGRLEKPFFMSAECFRLLGCIMRVDASKRYTISDILADTWMSAPKETVAASSVEFTPVARAATIQTLSGGASHLDAKRALFVSESRGTNASANDGFEAIASRDDIGLLDSTSAQNASVSLLFACSKCGRPDSAVWDFRIKAPSWCKSCTLSTPTSSARSSPARPPKNNSPYRQDSPYRPKTMVSTRV